MPLPTSVASALAALVPHDALSNAFGGGSRNPGSLSWRHELIDEPEAAQLLGTAVPTLPIYGRLTSWNASPFIGAPSESLQSQLAAGFVLLHLRVIYLPGEQPWEQALRGRCCAGVARSWTCAIRTRDPQRRQPWPQRVAGSGDAGGGDYAVVTVEGVEVGVQVDDASGVVQLSWLARVGDRVLLMGLLTRQGSAGCGGAGR